MGPEDELIRDEEVAQLLGVAPSTVRAWRHHGRGPSYVKVGGRAVRYRRGDVVAYIHASRVDPTQQEDHTA